MRPSEWLRAGIRKKPNTALPKIQPLGLVYRPTFSKAKVGHPSFWPTAAYVISQGACAWILILLEVKAVLIYKKLIMAQNKKQNTHAISINMFSMLHITTFDLSCKTHWLSDPVSIGTEEHLPHLTTHVTAVLIAAPITYTQPRVLLPPTLTVPGAGVPLPRCFFLLQIIRVIGELTQALLEFTCVHVCCCLITLRCVGQVCCRMNWSLQFSSSTPNGT